MTSFLMWDQGGQRGPGEVVKKYSLPSLPSNQIQVLGSQLKTSESSLSSPVGFWKAPSQSRQHKQQMTGRNTPYPDPHLHTQPLPTTATGCRCCVPARVSIARVFLFYTFLTLFPPLPAMWLSLLMPFKSVSGSMVLWSESSFRGFWDIKMNKLNVKSKIVFSLIKYK